MTTSNPTFPQRLTEVDELICQDHYYLTAEDKCYFLGEYTARKGYTYSATNGLIINIKKSVEKRGTPQWKYKRQAIAKAAASFRSAICENFINSVTCVPIPPSKKKTDPLYDDRVIRLIHAIRPTPPLDLRELVVQAESTTAVHDSAIRKTPEELEELYRIDQNLLKPIPVAIAIFDDVLTTGAHFRAMKSIISKSFKNIPIFGFFVARRVPETIDFDSF